ncbi:hypothetical protein ACGF0D_43480 [Kitasatospora sp. NPDC048298]|uniref:hypothetical protein n=1 Tax=Kitasatospora sp. NPDC048298 TaxID=3364049 RepID=UPI00371F7A0F
MGQGTDWADHRALADRLARKAEKRTGENHVTETTGEGLAAIAHVLLGSLPNRRSPKVWLGVRSGSAEEGGFWVSADRIIASRVRPADRKDIWILEVFVPEFAPDQWLTVTVGSGEWFELNAPDQLLDRLEKTARGDEPHVSSVFLQAFFPRTDGKDGLEFNRND